MNSFIKIGLSLVTALLSCAPLFAEQSAPASKVASPRPVESNAEWQWSAAIEPVISSETQDHPRAFLWIPPNCQRVRAVILGQHNMLEEGILEHPALRRALADVGMAAVWVTPAFDGVFRFDQGAGDHFQTMMSALARESGYRELEYVPIVPIGHSAMAGFPYHFAAWNPARTLAAISCKGQWPDFRDANSPPWKDSDLDGVPLLFVSGEYEDANGRATRALNFKKKNPRSVLTMLADAGGGHFDFHDRVVEYIALYLRKVAAARLPKDAPLDGSVTLNAIDQSSGWLVDRWRKHQSPKAPAAPVGSYTGPANEAFWCFDEELARATESYGAEYRDRKTPLLGYMQKGAVVEQGNTHQQVSLAFLPDPDGDGLTFKLTGTFLNTVPAGSPRPASWTGLPAGSPIGHPTAGGPVGISRICGPVEQLSADTFAVRFGRMGTTNTKRGREIWLMATHPGDAEWQRAVQQSQLLLPSLVNTAGADQTIDFSELHNQRAGVNSLPLKATSSAGAKVYFYVREGPARVNGDTLEFTAIPPRANFPVKVTVVAWQWGRTIEPKVRSAMPVTRTFLIEK